MQDERDRKQDSRRNAASIGDTPPPADERPRTRQATAGEQDALSDPQKTEHQERKKSRPLRKDEAEKRPVPGVKHEPEPDAGNIMPAEDEPGTL